MRGNFNRSSRSFRIIQFSLAVAVISAGTALGQVTTPTMSVTDRLSASFASVAKSVEPAVVSIDAKSSGPEIAVKGTTPGDSDDVLEMFRRQFPTRPVYAVGSGFIVDPSGYIVTNKHVIARASRITVRLDSGEELSAKVIGSDDETDIAVLKVDFDKPLPFLKFGDSDKSEVGDWVLALGSPFGLEKTVTAGIISQKGRETPYSSVFQKFIQTDAAINQGNSGGPLVNMDGEVIGVNSQIATSNGGSSGIGFALPSTATSYVYRQIRANGHVRRGYLGAGLDSVKAEYAKVYGLADAKGAIIVSVRDKLAAAGIAGLRPGDVIVSFNGQPVVNAVDLIAKVAGTAPDETVNIEYLRENGPGMDRKSATLKLQERPSTVRPSDDVDGDKPPASAPGDAKPFGLTLAELTPTIAASYKLEGKPGVLVKEISPSSDVADIRTSTGEPALSEGDVIQRINRKDVTDLKSFSEIAGKLKPGDAVVLQVAAYDPRTKTSIFKIVQFTIR